MPKMPKILLIEDNKILSMVASRHLSQNFPELHVESVPCATQAIQLLTRKPADIIIMDCGLPDMDGQMLFAELKRLFPETVMIVTSAAPPEFFTSLERKGVIFGILHKPFELFELNAIVRKAFCSMGFQLPSLSPMDVTAAPKEVIPQNKIEKNFDRHAVLNQLSGLMAGIRALEADLNADAECPDKIKSAVDEYVPKLVAMVKNVTASINSIERAGFL